MATYTCCIVRRVAVLPTAAASPLTTVLLARTMATRRQKLTEEERKTALAPLLGGGWTLLADRDAINKTFTFTDFNKAWGWMSRVALHSEKNDHHPEWRNVYNRVEVTWTTHDCGGLSKKDVTLASFCDLAYNSQ